MTDPTETRGYAAIGLQSPRDAQNIGGALRAAGCFGASLVAISSAEYGGAPTDTQKVFRHLPMQQVSSLEKVMPANCVGVTVDLIEGATPLPKYTHPERAFYIFGPENGTVSEEVRTWCRDTIMIPANHCLNLAASVNVVLFDRVSNSYESS